jgi:peptide/nickel transport system substrate-binding protein
MDHVSCAHPQGWAVAAVRALSLGAVSRFAMVGVAVVGLLCVATFGEGTAFAQKYGGVLKAVHRENPPSLLPHEWATMSSSWPVMPVYNNLVSYNPDHAVDSADDLTGELAEKWAWSNAGKTLTFTLRRGVMWHDGQPFTSADVKYTFDLIRGANPERKLRSSPRKLWFEQVESITTNGDYEVSFNLKRRQPSLLSMTASGYMMVIPAHVDLASLRTTAIGTGPFMLKEYLIEQRIVLEKNPHYFVPGRPYLDGISYVIIRDPSARATALATGQIDLFFPQEGTPGIRDQVKSAFPQVVIQTVVQEGFYNIVVNTQKPPFNDLKLRQAVNYALDRKEFLQTQQGGTIAGGILVPPPYSRWGLPEGDLGKLPGWGDGKKDKAMSRKLLADLGYTPDHPLKIKVSTRATTNFQNMAVWMVSQLKDVGIDATLEVVETGLWFPKMERGDYEMGANMSGTAAEDPDVAFYEHFGCGSPRNYSFYCNPEVQGLIDQQSQESDPKKRLDEVRALDRRLQTDVARAMLGQALDFVMYAPYVKGYVPHNSIYSYGRMQNVWLDR